MVAFAGGTSEVVDNPDRCVQRGRRTTRVRLLAAVVSLATLATASTPAAAAVTPVAPTSGTFSVLTYNVAGLPEPLSSGDPATNTRRR
ncbi:hypothetical protein GA0070560_10238 [Micromonospora halophytica]|uniref:Endonuclease/Exonuclease/phosphatase family protein n=1 Tax=Micromonospora halophytica TaxID=47864 RepID=A0A1C5GSW2_9ACTN|nr:hypothetical protein GA0070560_10238 [Micromonospora halophytica]